LKFTGGKGESEIVSMLQRVPLFSGLDTKDVRHIAESFKEMKYTPGQIIEKEGEKGVSFFLVTEGSVDIKKGTKTLAKLGPGQFFGEMSLLDSGPRSATAVASESSPTKCLAMTSWTWEAFLQTKPKISIALLKELAKRLRETDQKLSE
jgi:CRP/FNR family transcriptional regulator, cyclic AMP receptor protein